MHIRGNMIPLARAFKERAAFTSSELLAALPAGPDAHQYVRFDISTGNGKLLLGRPNADDPEGQRLWDALQQQYSGELKAPTRVMIQDWPAIAEAWKNYFVDKRVTAARSPATATSGPVIVPETSSANKEMGK